MENDPIVGASSDGPPHPESIDQATQSAETRSRHSKEMPLSGSPLDQVSHYLDRAFDEADWHGTSIDSDDARAVATLLTQLVGTGSAMDRFAQDGEVQAEQLLRECHALEEGAHHTPDVLKWIGRLEQYLGSLGPAGPTDAPSRTAELSSKIEQGIAAHGDAFSAYLELPDTAPAGNGPIESFYEFYVASYASMDDLLNDLTEVQEWETAVDQLAEAHGIHGFIRLDRSTVEDVARATWDIVEIGGRLHAFLK